VTDELSRDEVSEILEAIYKENFEMPELRDRIAKIPKLLDKYEGKWDGMLKSAYKKFGKPNSLISEEEAAEEPEEEAAEEPEEEAAEEPEEEAAEEPEEEAAEEPEEEAAEEPEEEAQTHSFSDLKSEILTNPDSPESWIKLANYFQKIGLKGRAEECNLRAKDLS